jgi:two-component system NtrC family sensor kinase
MNRSIPWVRRLGSKLAGLIALLSLLVVGFFALMAIRVQKQYAVAELGRGSAQLIETIKSSIYHHMLADERQTAYLTMETIGRQKGIDSVRMYNATGRITFSKHVAEVGMVVDRKATACAGCHAAPQPGPLPTLVSDQRVEEAPDGHRVLGVATPISTRRAAGPPPATPTRSPPGARECSTWACRWRRPTRPSSRSSGRSWSSPPAPSSCWWWWCWPRARLGAAADQRPGGRHAPRGRGRLLGESPSATTTSWAAGAQLQRDDRLAAQDRRGAAGAEASLERQVQERTAALRQAQDQLVQSEKMSSLASCPPPSPTRSTTR